MSYLPNVPPTSGGVGPAGPQGPAGPTGPIGPTGPAGADGSSTVTQYDTHQINIIPGQLWLEVSGQHSAGEAMGLMCLTYSSQSYDNINLMVKTVEGQVVGTKLFNYVQ